VGRLLAPSAGVAASVRRAVQVSSCERVDPGGCLLRHGDRRRGSVGGRIRREYRPLSISNDNPRIGDGCGLSPTGNV